MNVSHLFLRMARSGKTILPKRSSSKERKTSKQQITLMSDEHALSLSGHLTDPDLVVESLCIYDRNQLLVTELVNHQARSTFFRFEFNPSHIHLLIDHLIQHQDTHLEQEDFLEESALTPETLLPHGRFSLYLKYRKPLATIPPETLEKWQESGLPSRSTITNESYVREITLGRFLRTTIPSPLSPLFDEAKQHRVFLYTDLKGNIRLLLNKEPVIKSRLQIDRIDKKHSHETHIEGKLFSRHSFLKKGQLILVHRETGDRIALPVDWFYDQEASQRRFGLYRYTYRTQIDWSALQSERLLHEGIYDSFMELTYYHRLTPRLVRLGRARYITRHLTTELTGRNATHTMHVTPYFTVGHRNLSFELSAFTNENYRYLEHMMTFAPLYRLFADRKTWLIGERPYKAQDNGYHFFRFMREQHAEHPAYYVIDPNSPEYEKVAILRNTLPFRSKEHIYHSFMASKFVGTHHADYLYPLRSPRFKRKMKADRIFIQHGVLGAKNMEDQYGKFALSFDTDLFLVSSERERRLVMQDMGYRQDEIRITGLSRFDALLNGDTPVKRQILIIPTWRSWLQTPIQFLESDYFAQYSALLEHPRLHELAHDHDLEILFCLHPNMQQYASHFERFPVTVIYQGERDVQSLLKESLLLITDYSSVAFDFSFLGRPVHYFQFDARRFIGPVGSHLDLAKELPGPISTTVDDLIADLEATASRDFAMLPSYKERAAVFLKPTEQSYSEDIYQTILDYKQQRHVWETIQTKEASLVLFRLFRRSRFYFPIMKISYRLMKKLPVQENKIVFESGLGKQYGDSPRYIYEELRRLGSTHQVIWVHNKRLYLGDDHVNVIKRLSPRYFYHLATAKYWVNNQNFPHYMTRRKETTYIQTWHGTPLKKMLFDLEEIHGRDAGYVDRVTRSIQQWSVLLSPSSYATAIFKSAFQYEGTILESGYPRNDLFFADATKKVDDLRAQLNISPDKKVILYAPTFRDHHALGNGKFFFDYPFEFSRVAEALGDDYVFLIRTHVLVTKKPKIPSEYREQFLDVTNYPDIQELYLLTDLLITDYSSVFFDFANLNRPVLFYAYDLELYRDTLRGFYLDYQKDLPGPIIEEELSFYEALATIPSWSKDYQIKLDHFRETFCAKEDGLAANRVVRTYFLDDAPLEASETAEGIFVTDPLTST